MTRFSGHDDLPTGQMIVFGLDGAHTAFDFLATLEAISGMTLRGGPISVASRDDDGQLAVVRYGEQAIEGVVGGSITSSAAQLLITALGRRGRHLRASHAANATDNDLHAIGIDDEFCTHLYRLLTCNSSVICFLVWGELHDWNLDQSLLSHVQVIQKPLSVMNENELTCKLGCMLAERSIYSSSQSGE
jgi:uncharacterized membrane protein